LVLAFARKSAIIAGVSGISFLIDAKGKKTAAVIDLRRYRKLLEDFFDTSLVQARTNEPRESLATVKHRLKLAQADG
jgi:hypothetical protein